MTNDEKQQLKKELSDRIVPIIAGQFIDSIVSIVETMDNSLPSTVDTEMRKQFINNFIDSQVAMMESGYKVDIEKFKESLKETK